MFWKVNAGCCARKEVTCLRRNTSGMQWCLLTNINSRIDIVLGFLLGHSKVIPKEVCRRYSRGNSSDP